MEVSHGTCAQVCGEPRGVKVECWCGMLYHIAVFKPRESLAVGDVLWVIVLVIGQVEGILFASKGRGGLGGVRVAFLVYEKL